MAESESTVSLSHGRTLLQKEGLSVDSSLGRGRVSVQLRSPGTSGWLLRMLPTRFVSCSCLPRNHYTSKAGTD